MTSTSIPDLFIIPDLLFSTYTDSTSAVSETKHHHHHHHHRWRLRTQAECLYVRISCNSFYYIHILLTLRIGLQFQCRWPGDHTQNNNHPTSLLGKTCETTQKNVKSHVFWILKKNVKKRTYSFTGHLITQPLILIFYRKSVPVSHQHQTSCSEMRTQETMQLRNVCDKRL